jgi:hypothetical protein
MAIEASTKTEPTPMMVAPVSLSKPPNTNTPIGHASAPGA